MGIWNEGDAAPCWTSTFLAASTTSITVDALAGNDEVYLHLMSQASFPFLAATTVSGGAGNDLIWGSWAPDLLKGDADMDTIRGLGSNDELRGGTENDTLFGGLGDDEIQGNEHRDTIYGEEGDDTLYGNDGNDKIFGGPDHDFIVGGADQDVLFGEAGEDQIFGGSGHDNLSGGGDDDQLWGEDGSDAIQGGAGNDSIDGGSGSDVLWSLEPAPPPDQPWRNDGQGTPGWNDMDASGPDNDGACDIEDFHADLDGTTPCPGTFIATTDNATVSHSMIAPGVWIDLLNNDLYDPMQPPTVNILTPPAHGTVVSTSLGVTYNPDDDYATCHVSQDGTYTYCYDVFTYNLAQGGATSNTAPVIVKITNHKPVGTDDSLSTVKNTPQTINAVDNDIDNDPYDTLTVASVTDPAHGSATYDGQTVTYTPDADYVGTDEFFYTATDGLAESAQVKVTVNVGAPLMLDLPPAENTSDAAAISDADLALLAGEAARRWVAAGVDPITAERALAGTEFIVADLPGSALGMELPGTIVIDVNAAGYGWFVDATPGTDEEFSIFVSLSERQAGTGSAALGKADLLTALMHEFGHALGMVHLEGEEFEHSVMNDTLGLSMRRVPTAADILAADEYYASLGDGSTLRRRKW
ncbi:MAG TPA: Ig-like domain-containing protein [Pirellulaceae bacterium]|nr:Ig-like domain-containing protein [Pirellulaceae bacterium]